MVPLQEHQIARDKSNQEPRSVFLSVFLDFCFPFSTETGEQRDSNPRNQEKETGCRGIWIATVAKLCFIFLDPPGHVTSLMGLLRPSINGPIFVYRAPCRIGGLAPRRIRVMTTTTSGPEPILEEIAANFEDLADPVQVEPWRLLRLITIEEDRGIGSFTIRATSWLPFAPSAPLGCVLTDWLRWSWARRNSPSPLFFLWLLMWSY